MSKKKLTLSVDATVVERAKRFSRRNNTSVSELVSAFLASLEDNEQAAAPIVDRLVGIIPDRGSEEDYHRYLEEKYR